MIDILSNYYGIYPFMNEKYGMAEYAGAWAAMEYQTISCFTSAYIASEETILHELAHQWWGAGVGWETYHDQWLSEGFAEYSACLYLQAVKGNATFLDRLKDYRKDIYSAHKFLLGPDEESGPIALGYRTSSTKTAGDYSLIIYRKGALVLHMLRNLLIDFNTMNTKLNIRR